MTHFLLHSIDACTQSAGPKRKRRRQRYGHSLTLAVGLLAMALLTFGVAR